VAAGPAAHVTPITSRGPGARTARRVLPGRYRRSAARHGRDQAGDRRARQRLARARPGAGFRPGSRACHHGVLPAGRAGRHPAAATGALLSAAAAAGRRVLGLFSGPAACHAAGLRLDWDLGPAARPLAQARAGAPDLLLDAGCPEAGQAALVITGRGGPGAGVLYAACERVLRPGGVLAVLTASTPRPGGLRDDPGEVIAAARAAGLIYAQHIVALHAAITEGQLTPGPPGTARPDEAPGPPAVCASVHSDLLVFTKPGGALR